MGEILPLDGRLREAHCISKRELLTRVRDLVVRVRAVKGYASIEDVAELQSLEREVTLIEDLLSDIIDDYMAAQLRKRFLVTPTANADGLSGRWQQHRDWSDRRKREA